MKIRTRVVVYGNSLHMAGIAASLKMDQSLDVVCVDPHSSTDQQSMSELNPSVIVFDLTYPSTSVDVSLLREKPGVLLVGIDPASDEILLLAGYPRRVPSVSELAYVIQHK